MNKSSRIQSVARLISWVSCVLTLAWIASEFARPGPGAPRILLLTLLTLAVAQCITLVRRIYSVAFRITAGELMFCLFMLMGLLLPDPDSIIVPLPGNTGLNLWVLSACLLGGAALICAYALEQTEKTVTRKLFIGTALTAFVVLLIGHYWPRPKTIHMLPPNHSLERSAAR